MALTFTPAPDLGTPCPDFDLPGVDGRRWRRSDFSQAKALVVMFICNHCPYVQAIEDRLIALGHELRECGVKMVAISSNDATKYLDDSFENLALRWRAKSYPFPYLHDETQEVARAFGAVCTPDFFVYDAKGMLAYRGRLDDSWKDAAHVTRRELRDAVMVILDGRVPAEGEQKPSMGCNIKWKADSGSAVLR